MSAASQLQVFFEKQDKKIKEEEKKALSLKSAERRVSENEVKEQKKSGEEQILIKAPEKEVLKKEETGEHLKIEEGFQNEDRTSFKPLSQKEKENLVKRAENCSTRETERLLSEADPSLSLLTRREKVRFLGKGKVEIKVIIDEQCHKELEKLKNLLSHRNPKLSYGELISILSKEAVKKHDPKEKNIRKKKQEKIQEKSSLPKLELTNKSAGLTGSSRKSGQTNQYTKEKATFAPKSEHQIKKISRFVPSHLRKYVWERDGGQCSYVHHETKRRCASRHLLQIDHIQPFALGGRTEKENLRLLCAGHNQYRR